jgi:hypothetical protein
VVPYAGAMSPTSISFIVSGEPLAPGGTTRGSVVAHPAEPEVRGRIKQAVRIGPTARAGAASEVTVVAEPGKDVVVLRLAGGPVLTLHPEHARDLLLAQTETTRGGAGTESALDRVQVPARLRWRGQEAVGPARRTSRGLLGDVVLSAIEVVTDLFTDSVIDTASGLAASAVVKRVDAQVEEGVYGLAADRLTALKGSGRRLTEVPAAPGTGAQLILVHGTFSETHGTFGKLWSEHPQRVRDLFKHYGDRVYALDHQTLGQSPIANALTLARALPARARVHLLTHSRGGLVAEVFARVCGDSRPELTPFSGEDHAEQRELLKQLVELAASKQLKVERVVRVACPARGTLLASKRLDAYVSVLKWSLQLAGVPVAPALVDFLGAVAKHRADPALLPGLAAQIPDSPLVRWLHAVPTPIAGDLRVIAGDLEGNSLTSWLKTLLADSFYWTDNDLVVQTRSMYGGAPREDGARFLLHQGAKVSHFAYFKNERTAGAVVAALTQDTPAEFRAIGPLSYAGKSSTGLRAARPSTEAEVTAKPALFLLPGILGSNLKLGDQRVWLDWRIVNGLQRLEYSASPTQVVTPDGPIGAYYDALAEFLADSHEVIPFAFDWRRPIEEEAQRLAGDVQLALDARSASRQPVRMLAHSMGGLVARTMQLEASAIWERMMAHAGARLVMLGTPNDGSWAPMQVLSGDDTFGNMLAAVGAPFREHEARALMAGFPGFLQLQAGLSEDEHGLGNATTWQMLADDDLERVRAASWWHRLGLQFDSLKWGVPTQATLDRALSLRKRLDHQRSEGLAAFKGKLALVVGRAPLTPTGYELGADGFVYLDEPDAGDGRVPHASALLPGVDTWMIDSDHAQLPAARAAFAGYLDLLQRGRTDRFERFRTTRSVQPAAVVRRRASRVPATFMPAEREEQLLDTPGAQRSDAAQIEPLHVTVINGDLTFVKPPLLLGHYVSTRLTGTEQVMNQLIGGDMTTALALGLYPEAPGTHRIFINARPRSDNPLQPPRPEAVVVVGLGNEGQLRGSDLAHTIRQAVMAWSQRAAENPKAAPAYDLAATLIGSGGAGISAGQAAELIAQGVYEANELLAEERERGRRWPRVGHLQLIELYLDRACEAWRALQAQAAAKPGRYHVSESVEEGTGPLSRPLHSGYRGAEYDYIAALSASGANGQSFISYTIDTKRARAEVHTQSTQLALLRNLVATASDDRNTDGQIGRSLFQLLVPIEMEPFMSGSTEMQLQLDRGTAGIPWELLDRPDERNQEGLPWAIRAKLIRKLRTEAFRASPLDTKLDAEVLVIGEPECDPRRYPPLPGAAAEALAVASRLTAGGALPGTRVRSLIPSGGAGGADARTVINALLERPWRIVHIAGHGEPPEKRSAVGAQTEQAGHPRGVVLSSGLFLGPQEFQGMRAVPELVFLNCCFLAARDAEQLLVSPGRAPRGYDRPDFASSVADALINLGVQCVVVAGWAVEDDPAQAFATAFYDALLRGRRFIEAVTEARLAAYALGGNTWGAYQCYGDPDWVFRSASGDAQAPRMPLADEFAGVASWRGLCQALDTLRVRSEYQNAPSAQQQEKLRHLEVRFAARWSSLGQVAEAFGMAWLAVGDTAKAIEWLERARAVSDGAASIKALEQLGNTRVRAAWEQVAQARDRRDELRLREPVAAQRGEAAADCELASAQDALQNALSRARDEIGAAKRLLEQLVSLHPTAERWNLLGSAYKRLALLESLAGNRQAEDAALGHMYDHYLAAEDVARKVGASDLFYPAMNRMAAELVVKAGQEGWSGFDAATLASASQSLELRPPDKADFWSVAGKTELHMYQAIARNALAAELGQIETDYRDLNDRMSAPRSWRSVYDQAEFVLAKYVARATPEERAAANAVLTLLARFAHAGRAPVHDGQGDVVPAVGPARAGRSVDPPFAPVRADGAVGGIGQNAISAVGAAVIVVLPGESS